MKTPRSAVLALLAFTFVFAPQTPRTALAEPNGSYRARLVSPKAGAILMPGTVVRVEWTAVYPAVDLTMCEQEVLLSLDGGRTFSFITSLRDPNVHSFNWIVPRSPSRNAVLDIRFGCLGIYPESYSPQIQSTFQISEMD
jgi:hypothetical protein